MGWRALTTPRKTQKPKGGARALYSQILRDIEHLHDPDSLTHSMVTLTSHQNTVLLLFKLRLRTSNPRPRLGQGVARAAATLLYGVMLPPPRACAAPRQTWNGCAVSCARTPRPRGLSNRRRPSRRPTRLGAKSRDLTGMPQGRHARSPLRAWRAYAGRLPRPSRAAVPCLVACV